jgi:hemin uptake protein HemP
VSLGDSEFAAENLRIINSENIFGSRREIIIRHAGVLYRLRITRTGKLLLTK